MKIWNFTFLAMVLFLFGCNSRSVSSLPPAEVSAVEFDVTNTTSQPTPTAPVSCLQFATTQAELNGCADQQTQDTYAKLSSLVVELQGHMNDSQYAMLLEIEAEWEQMIITHCQWEANFFEGGSIQPMWYSGCLGQQYHDRIEALRINLCEGNGMTGECEESLKYKD